MKINDVISEQWVKLSPEDRKKEDEAAAQEFNALRGIDSVDGPKLAQAFRNAYAKTGSVDSAYEEARAIVRKMSNMNDAVPTLDKMQKKFVTSLKGPAANPSNPEPLKRTIFAPKGEPGPSGPGRGKYTQYRDGSDRAGGAGVELTRSQQIRQELDKWYDDTLGDIPGAGLLKKAAKGAEKVGRAVTAPVRAVTEPAKSGYDFFKSPDALDTFRRSKRGDKT